MGFRHESTTASRWQAQIHGLALKMHRFTTKKNKTPAALKSMEEW